MNREEGQPNGDEVRIPYVSKSTGSMERDEIDLIKLVSGQKAEWDRFVTTTASLIYSMVERTLRPSGIDRADVADVVQDVYLHFCQDGYRVLKRYDPARARLSTWCGAIARNKAIDWLRRRRLVSIPLDEAEEQRVEFSDPFRDRLSLPPQLLTGRQALILRLSYEEEMPVEEIARLLSIEPQTVRSARHKALVRLRRFYENPNPAEGDVCPSLSV